MFLKETIWNSGLVHADQFSRLTVSNVKSRSDHVNPKRIDSMSTSLTLKFFIVLSGFLLFSFSCYTQWHQSSKGMYGGNVSAFYVDPVSGYMYASSSGVIMSKDNGNSWKAIDSSLVFEPSYLGTGVSYSMRNSVVSAAGRYVYSIATRGQYLLIGTSAGVYVSSDTGRTWTAGNSDWIGNRPKVYCFAFKGNETYIGTNYGVYFSADTGKNWVHKKTGHGSITDLVFIGDNLLASTWSQGSYMTNDNGNTWTESLAEHPEYGRSMSLLGINHIRDLELSGDRIFAGTRSGVYLSRDSCGTWVPKNGPFGINTISIKGDTILASKRSGAADSAKLFISTDEGTSWRQINIPSHVTGRESGAPDNWSFHFSRFNIPSHGSFDIYSHMYDFFMGTDFGVLKSKDGGGSWQTSENGIMKLGVTSLCKSGNHFFAGTSTNGIFVSEDNCNTWKQVNNGLIDQNETGGGQGSAWKIRAIAVKNDIIFAGTDGSGVFYSYNRGISWSTVNSGLTGYDGNGLCIKSLIVAGNKILAGTEAGIFVTTYDPTGTKAGVYGNTWTRIPAPEITGMVYSGNNIYCILQGAGVFISEDQGVNWTDISGNISRDDIDCIAVVDNIILAGSVFNGIYRYDDKSNTWSSVNNGLRWDNAGYMILSLFSKGSVIYAGTGAGVYKSDDKGENWTPMNDGIPTEGVQYLGVIDSFMFAGTVGDGLWKRTFLDTTNSDPTNISSVKVPAVSVYPNPAEDEITISFDDLPDEEYTVEILNIAGVVLYKTKVKRTLNKISLEGFNYRGFCILKITDSKGKIRAVQKIIKL